MSPTLRNPGERGFTVAELLVGTTILLVVLAGASEVIMETSRASALAASTTDVNQSTRIAMNVIIRDLTQAGEGDYALRTGVPIPSGDGAIAIERPRPLAADWDFPSRYTAIPAVSPENGIGIIVNDVPTDVLTLLYEDRRLDLSGVFPDIADDGGSMTFPDDFEIDNPAIGIQVGDLIRFGNGAMQEVTEVEGQLVTFASDVESGLNQRGSAEGSVLGLRTEGVFPPTLAVSRVFMITYYITLDENDVPQLIRRVNYGPERVVTVGIENLQLSWDLVNGTTNPTNVEAFSTTLFEGQIRKANLYIAARSIADRPGTDEPFRTSLSTQVSLRSMAFVSRYDIQ
jgi:type II secretory pathway pseudopilin PulG